MTYSQYTLGPRSRPVRKSGHGPDFCTTRFFLFSCHGVRREQLALKSSSELELANAHSEKCGGDGTSFATLGSELSSASKTFDIICFTNAATGTLKPGLLTTLPTIFCKKASYGDRQSMFWLSVSSSTLQWITTVMISPRNRTRNL